MVGQEAVVQAAGDEAERIVSDAQERAHHVRMEAEDYVDAKLAQFEIALRKIQEEAQSSTRQVARTLDQIELGRQKLRGAPVTEAEQRLGGHDDDGSPGEPPPAEAPREIDIEVEEVE